MVGSSEPSPTGAVEVVEEDPMQHTPRSIKGQIGGDNDACTCSEILPLPVVTGNNVRCESVRSDVQASMACSVVAAIKHVTAPMCT